MAVVKKQMGELKTLSGKEKVPEWAKTMLTEWAKMDRVQELQHPQKHQAS